MDENIEKIHCATPGRLDEAQCEHKKKTNICTVRVNLDGQEPADVRRNPGEGGREADRAAVRSSEGSDTNLQS